MTDSSKNTPQNTFVNPIFPTALGGRCNYCRCADEETNAQRGGQFSWVWDRRAREQVELGQQLRADSPCLALPGQPPQPEKLLCQTTVGRRGVQGAKARLRDPGGRFSEATSAGGHQTPRCLPETTVEVLRGSHLTRELGAPGTGTDSQCDPR